uniref:Ig-like domain-containing protein n=1 Tax=Scleropages formosus TaxID=113540 RepID=A0A8C9TZX2_SCLFO
YCSLPVRFSSYGLKEASFLWASEFIFIFAQEGGSTSLSCELSVSGVQVKWRKDGVVLVPSDRHTISMDGSKAELVVNNLTMEDAGEYTCDTGGQQTTAFLKVKGVCVTQRLGEIGMLVWEKNKESPALMHPSRGERGPWYCPRGRSTLCSRGPLHVYSSSTMWYQKMQENTAAMWGTERVQPPSLSEVITTESFYTLLTYSGLYNCSLK